jgi:hypothetical protein
VAATGFAATGRVTAFGFEFTTGFGFGFAAGACTG